MRVDKEKKIIYISEDTPLHDIVNFLNNYEEGEYKIMIYGT